MLLGVRINFFMASEKKQITSNLKIKQQFIKNLFMEMFVERTSTWNITSIFPQNKYEKTSPRFCNHKVGRVNII